MKILVTGLPGIGKTTVVQRVVAMLGEKAAGFITREIREGGDRKGFMIETLDGRKGILAVRSTGGKPRVGRYRVIVSNLEGVGVTALQRAWRDRKIIVVDEIGKMELLSEKFRDTIAGILESDAQLLATLSIARHPFLEAIRQRNDVELIPVTRDNRQSLPETIVEMLRQGFGGC